MTQAVLRSTKLAAGAILLSALIGAAPARRAGAGLWRRRERLRRLCRRRRGGQACAHDQSRIRRPSRRRDLGALHHGYRLGRHHRHPGSLPPGRDARNLGPGQQTYSSSGIVENGNWWLAGVNIYDAGGSLMARAEVPVLLVELHHLPARCAGLPAARAAPGRGDDGRRLRPRKRTAGPWHAGFQCLPHLDPCPRARRPAASPAGRLAQRLCGDGKGGLSRPHRGRHRQCRLRQAGAESRLIPRRPIRNGWPRP